MFFGVRGSHQKEWYKLHAAIFNNVVWRILILYNVLREIWEASAIVTVFSSRIVSLGGFKERDGFAEMKSWSQKLGKLPGI